MEALLLNILFVAAGASPAESADGLFAAAPQSPDDSRSGRGGADGDSRSPEKGMEQVETLMSRLHQLTASVAADVDEHNTRVQAINSELTSGGDVVSIVERLVQINEQMQSQLHVAEKRLQTQAREIESHVQEARTDALTKLANRRAFDDELRRCVDENRTTGLPSCVMMVDVDYFKRFNDAYGHQAGDEVLKGVARVLRRELAGNEIVCRYGGEEFAVIFPGMGLKEVIPRAEKGRGALAREVFEFQGLDLRVTASGGVAQLEPNESGERVVKRADDALYVCKENGRNCGYWHDGKTSHAMTELSQDASCGIDGKKSRLGLMSHSPSTVFKLASELEQPKFDRRDRIAGLTDRETFCRDLDRRLAEQEKTGLAASVLLIEMDRFSEMVDEFGGKAAELALRAAAQILKVTMREMDHAARFDEAIFALLLPGAGLAEAGAVAERMRIAIENCKVPANGEQLRFTVSLGAAESSPGEKPDSILARVLRALETAKEAGGNTSLAVTETGEPCPMAMAT